MLRRQCDNQLPAERARETSKLIAIIDDDDAMQDSLRDLMEAAGLVARCFGSAKEFLESGLHRQAACLITDINMPKMSGLQLQTRLKDEECDIPIINFARRLTHAGPVSVIRVPLASSVIWLVTQLQE